ncbi:MAG: hypothetical protein Q9220_003667 [cf. Caloplaca sp. 1 TL-2023]
MASLGTNLNTPPDGDVSTGTSILINTWVFTSISAIVVGLKLWTRYKIIGQTGLDDALTVLALGLFKLFLLAFAPLITVSVHKGLGRHVYYLNPDTAIEAAKLAVLSNPLVFLAGAWPNISVAIAFNRILVPPQRWQVGVLFGVPILQCTLAVISSITTYTECSPLKAIWNPSIPHKCISPDAILAILYLNGAFSAFTHIFLAIVPIYGLWNIQMKLKTKVGVCLLMGSTAIAAIAAIIRTVRYSDPNLGTDFTHSIYRILNWAIIEAAFIIIAACIPSLRPFVRALSRSLHLDSARFPLLVSKGYYHSHSRRHRPPPLVPRESGSASTAVPSPRDKHEIAFETSEKRGSQQANKRQGSGETGVTTTMTTPPASGGLMEGGMGKEDEEGEMRKVDEESGLRV